ncbi:MAG: replicative DNA helicase, partial [Lentisphaeria bacterium]|nr:replicative DNA helicase [Lentisphaeria bacterium]
MTDDDRQNSRIAEIREDFGKASRSATVAAGGSVPVYADYETERAVIASILAEPETLQTVIPLLNCTGVDENGGKKKKKKQPEQNQTSFRKQAEVIFKDPRHSLVYEAILVTSSESEKGSTDLLTVMDWLKKKDRLAAIGGMDYLIELQASIPSAANLENWCSILRDYAMLREIVQTCSRSLEICRNPDQDIHQMLDEIESNLFAVRNNFARTQDQSFKDLLLETCQFFLDIFNDNIEVGIPTGYADLDNLIGGGLRNQEMIVLAARPSIGKTAIALNIVRNIIMKDPGNGARKKVAFFSLEMSAQAVTQRLLCTEAQVSLSRITHKQITHMELKQVTDAANRLASAKLKIDPTGGLSVFELRAKARKIKETQGLDLIVIDYLTLMRADVSAADGRQVEVAAISGGLKKIAKDLNVPVLVLAQLNRDVEKGQSKNARPKLSNLRESGA